MDERRLITPDSATTVRDEASTDEAAADDSPSLQYSGQFREEALEKISSECNGWRWYSPPLWLLRKVRSSSIAKRAPRRARRALVSSQNYIEVFEQHEFNKAWPKSDPMKNLDVPKDERVEIPGVWVVELFPPSHSLALRSRFQKNRWDKPRLAGGLSQGNVQRLDSSRSGRGWDWWVLGQLSDRGSKGTQLFRRQLPEQFENVEVMAVSIGGGLTAVVAHFQVSTRANNELNSSWHEEFEPKVRWTRGVPRALDRKHAAIDKAKGARNDIDAAARRWLTKACPGYFADTKEPHLTLDLMLLSQHDPLVWGANHDIFEALGLTNQDSVVRTSPTLPDLLLTPSTSPFDVDGQDRKWTLWGHRARATGNKSLSTSAHDLLRNTLASFALSALLNSMEDDYARLRDRAHKQRKKIRRKDLEKLRSDFLTTSLDVASAIRDINGFHERASDTAGAPRFEIRHAPALDDANELRPGDLIEEDLAAHLREEQVAQCNRLTQQDVEYRGILSTAASLGASIDAFKLGRAAIFIALASFGVALVTFLGAKIDEHSVLATMTNAFLDTPPVKKLGELVTGIWQWLEPIFGL